MLFLLFFILSCVVFVQILRYGQQLKIDMVPLITVNYAIAWAVSLAILAVRGGGWGDTPRWLPLAIGAVTGAGIILHIPFVLASYRGAGVGVTVATNRAALVLAVVLFVMLSLGAMPAVVFFPTSGSLIILCNVILSRWLWNEALLRRQIVGLAFAIAIVVLTNL